MSIEHDIPQGLGREEGELTTRRTIRVVIGLRSAVSLKSIPVDEVGQPVAQKRCVTKR